MVRLLSAKPSDPSPIDWAQHSTEHPFAGIERQTVHGENQTIVRYIYQPGSIFPVHRHPEEQVTIVLSGSIDFTVDGRPLTLSAGESALIPADVPHRATVTGSDVVETLNTMSPRRRIDPMTPGPEDEGAA